MFSFWWIPILTASHIITLPPPTVQEFKFTNTSLGDIYYSVWSFCVSLSKTCLPPPHPSVIHHFLQYVHLYLMSFTCCKTFLFLCHNVFNYLFMKISTASEIKVLNISVYSSFLIWTHIAFNSGLHFCIRKRIWSPCLCNPFTLFYI